MCDNVSTSGVARKMPPQQEGGHPPHKPTGEKPAMTRYSDYQTLINRGRKAGLSTRELYAAMATRPPEGADDAGRADGNGYVPGYNQQGQRVYRPLNSYPRP